MIEIVLEYLFQNAQQAEIKGLIAGEFVIALGVGLWGYRIYSKVQNPSDDWDEGLRLISIGMMVFAALDGVITLVRLLL